MNKPFLFFAAIIISTISYAQETPFIKLVNPTKANNTVSTSRQFIIGSTCKTCTVNINNNPVKVFATGAVAYEVILKEGVIKDYPGNYTQYRAYVKEIEAGTRKDDGKMVMGSVVEKA